MKENINIFRNKKTGISYRMICIGIDTTNERDGLQVVIYESLMSGRCKYVKDAGEFFFEFEKIGDKTN